MLFYLVGCVPDVENRCQYYELLRGADTFPPAPPPKKSGKLCAF